MAVEERLVAGPARHFARIALASVVLAGLFWSGSCRSLPKDELQRRLAALAKNAGLDEPERLPLIVDLGHGPRSLELVYVHRPAAAGSSARLPVVLVHGTPSTLYSWSELVLGGTSRYGEGTFAGLARDREVYAIEVLGHGIAPGEMEPFGFEACSRFVAAAIEALEIERAHLVGSSYGGEFAWRAALHIPERVASLVLLDSSGVRRRDEDWLPEERVMRENALADLGWILNSRERIESALAPHFDVLPPDRVEEFFQVCQNSLNWRAMIDLARDENGEREGDLVRVTQPTLLLWGEEDLAYPPAYYARRFAESIPEARLVTLPATGHYPHEQRPREVLSQLGEFFHSVEEAP